MTNINIAMLTRIIYFTDQRLYLIRQHIENTLSFAVIITLIADHSIFMHQPKQSDAVKSTGTWKLFVG